MLDSFQTQFDLTSLSYQTTLNNIKFRSASLIYRLKHKSSLDNFGSMIVETNNGILIKEATTEEDGEVIG